MVLTPNKKNYCTLIEIKEGKWFKDGKVDIKGLSIIKSEVNDTAQEFFKGLVEEMLRNDIDIIYILNKLEDFEDTIRESLLNGEKKFLKPISVKEFGAYETPWSEQGVLAINAWNLIHPSIAINTFPAKVDLVYLNLVTLNDLARLHSIDEKMFNIVKREIFENPNEKIANKGIAAIAIPREEDIPKWILPFIDIDRVIDYNIRNIIRILNSLGMETIHISANDAHYSNIIDL